MNTVVLTVVYLFICPSVLGSTFAASLDTPDTHSCPANDGSNHNWVCENQTNLSRQVFDDIGWDYTFENCRWTGGPRGTEDGGAISIIDYAGICSLTVDQCSFLGCSVTGARGGALLAVYLGSLTVTASSFSNNQALGYDVGEAGALYVSSVFYFAYISNCQFAVCHADSRAGGVYAERCRVSSAEETTSPSSNLLVSVTFSECSTTKYSGGGLAVTPYSLSFHVRDCEWRDCNLQQDSDDPQAGGGAIFFASTNEQPNEVIFYHCYFQGNRDVKTSNAAHDVFLFNATYWKTVSPFDLTTCRSQTDANRTYPISLECSSLLNGTCDDCNWLPMGPKVPYFAITNTSGDANLTATMYALFSEVIYTITGVDPLPALNLNGTLPAGVAYDSSGTSLMIVGAPDETGLFNYTIWASDVTGSVSVSGSIKVLPASTSTASTGEINETGTEGSQGKSILPIVLGISLVVVVVTTVAIVVIYVVYRRRKNEKKKEKVTMYNLDEACIGADVPAVAVSGANRNLACTYDATEFAAELDTSAMNGPASAAPSSGPLPHRAGAPSLTYRPSDFSSDLPDIPSPASTRPGSTPSAPDPTPRQ
jgi:hypothetical protein